VFDVFVLHDASMAGPGVLLGVWCAVYQLDAAADLSIKKGGILAPSYIKPTNQWQQVHPTSYHYETQ